MTCQTPSNFVICYSALNTSTPQRTRNPQRTKAKLLRVATRLFAKKGYDGASVDEIVAAAGVNKRMVYHYFGDKEGLYAEVLQSVFNQMARVEIEAFDETTEPAEAIRAILVHYFDFLDKRPDLVSLLFWENLRHGHFVETHAELLSKHSVIERLRRVIQRGIQTGVFHGNIDVRYLLISLISLGYIYHSNRYTLTHGVGLDLSSPDVIHQGLTHSIDLVLNGLLKR